MSPLSFSLRAAAEAPLWWSEFGLLIFSVLVVGALVGEIRTEKERRAPEHIEYTGSRGQKGRRRRRWRWNSFWVWVVILGVLGEMIADGGIWKYSDALQAFQDRETSTAVNKAAKAEKRAALANRDAALANERAQELAKEAADEKRRAAAIMEAMAWRGFRPAQTDAMLRVLSEKPEPVILAWVANDNEAKV